VSIAAKTTLLKMALDRLTHGDAKPPRTWSSVKHYEQLVKQGLAVEIAQANPLIRQFSITEKGLATVAKST